MIDISSFPANDSEWSEEQWRDMLIYLNEQGLASYKDMASTVLYALNPPQVGTDVATNKNFQSHYPKGKTMQAVMRWFYDREGVCVDCGTHLELQADHIIPKETFADKRDADYLENLELRCRRCNVIKRPSHKNGGKTYLTAAAALMWLLLRFRPSTYQEYEKICREYGLTMANIRFHEAWALAVWLNKKGLYRINK
jgi:5-methylcytosine-specific restriction endonuclease McrA